MLLFRVCTDCKREALSFIAVEARSWSRLYIRIVLKSVEYVADHTEFCGIAKELFKTAVLLITSDGKKNSVSF